MNNLKQTLIKRDGISEQEADELIQEARNDLYERVANGEESYDICEEYFGLEPDYIDDLI